MAKKELTEFQGYFTLEELEKIKKWEHTDVLNLIQYLHDVWAYADSGGFKKYWIKEHRNSMILIIELHTSGWSGNEDLINALLENKAFKNLWYFRWERGGHHWFKINFYQLGYLNVTEYCKINKLDRRRVSDNKSKYDWIIVSENKRLIKERAGENLSLIKNNVFVTSSAAIKRKTNYGKQNLF